MAQTADTIRDELEKQVAELRKEMTRLGKQAGDRAATARAAADDAMETAQGRAAEVMDRVRNRAQDAAGAARENPAATATALATVGLIGLVAGFALRGACARDDRR